MLSKSFLVKLLIWILSLILIISFGYYHDFRVLFTIIGIGLLSYSIIFLPFEWVKIKSNKNFKAEFLMGLFFIIILSGSVIFLWLKYHQDQLKVKGQLIFGIVVEKDVHKNSFVIEAEFLLNDQKYYSSGESRYLKLGDTVLIKYNPEFPDNNEILNLDKE